MSAGWLAGDDRGVSETTAVAILVGTTLLVTGLAAVNVLFLTETRTGPPEANFSYQHFPESGRLVITHDSGDPIRAGKLQISDGDRDVSWAQIANSSTTTEVRPGDVIQIGPNNQYGREVARSTTIRMLYVDGGNTTEIDRWAGPGA